MEVDYNSVSGRGRSNRRTDAKAFLGSRKALACVAFALGVCMVLAAFALAFRATQISSSCDKQAKNCTTLSTAEYNTTILRCRITGATLFPVGTFLVIVGLYVFRSASKREKPKAEVLVSTVTGSGLLKSPTAAQSRTASVVLGARTLTGEGNDLPSYEALFSVSYACYAGQAGAEGGSGEAVGASLTVMIDEDVRNPPPSYDEALILLRFNAAQS